MPKVVTYKRKQHWKRHTRNWQNSQSKHPSKGAIVSLPYFTPNVEIASGETMVGLMDYSQMRMEIALPENTIDKVKVGQKVLVTNYNIKSDTLSGLVSQLSPAINEDTRTYTGYITINNPELKLRPGMFAKERLLLCKRIRLLSFRRTSLTPVGGETGLSTRWNKTGLWKNHHGWYQ